MKRSVVTPLILTFAVFAGGCAAKTIRIQDRTTALNDCLSVTDRVYTKGKGKKAEVVGTETLGQLYDPACGDRQVLKEQERSAAAIELARIDAASQVLTAALTTAAEPHVRTEILRSIIERMDSEESLVRTSQGAANAKAGLTDEFVRTQLKVLTEKPKVTCRHATDNKGVMVFSCS